MKKVPAMADSADPTGPPNRPRFGNSLKHAFDGAAFLSSQSAADDPPHDTPDDTVERESDPSIESACSESDTESSRDRADFAASLRFLSESMLRTELAELEMIKARESRRLEAEMRKLESEAELTRMMMRNQLLIASFLSQKTSNRKRKRSKSKGWSYIHGLASLPYDLNIILY